MTEKEIAANNVDSMSAVVKLALAFVEAQKDIAQLRRQLDVLFNSLKQIDTGVGAKFKEQDKLLDQLFKEVEQLNLKGVAHAANYKREKNTKVDEKDLRSEKSQASLLRDDK